MLADLTEVLEGPSPDVADDPREAEDTFRGVSTVVVLSKFGIDGFLKSPLIDGRLPGRAAKVLDPNLGVETSGACLSGLGVLDCAALVTAVGG